MTQLNKAEVIADNARAAGDTGSPEVQVALPVSYTHLTLPTICSV